jgi:hypothetical protein
MSIYYLQPYLMEIEYQIELANISEIFIQYFNKSVDKFQYDELVLILIDNGDEIKTCVSFIYDFVLFIL